MQSGNEQNKELLLEKALDLLAHGTSLDDIEIAFIKQALPEELIAEVMRDLKHHIHKQNLKAGRSLILSGCIVMVFGFVLTCVKFHSNESVNIVMYGFTTLGICILFVGLYKIFS